ncbi:MAG: DinB family protein [Gemmatimonadaceae bacterium]|nr:DinB family protein [Gemmatimonadaceae bacterium]
MLSLHPRIAEVVAELESAQAQMHAAIAAVPASAHTARPNAESWTIAEVIEHLMMLEDSTGRLIGGMLKQLEGTTDSETDPIGPTMARFQVEKPLRKLAAPDMVKPTGVPMADALARQSASRERLISSLKAGSGRALNTKTYPHPFLGELNGYQWALLVAQHQRRHLVQIDAIAAAVA